MELYIEKGFVDNFWIENNSEKRTEIQRIICSIFSEYSNINWFLDSTLESIEENEWLYKLSDINSNFKTDIDFNNLFNDNFVPKKQTLV